MIKIIFFFWKQMIKIILIIVLNAHDLIPNQGKRNLPIRQQISLLIFSWKHSINSFAAYNMQWMLFCWHLAANQTSLLPLMAATQSSKPSPQPPNPFNSNTQPTTDHNQEISHGRTRFLGVRQRPSGRWVAEIKVSSQKLRLWLGTFDRAEDAAMAYDRAARLLRGRSAKTNFPYDHHHGFFNSTINEQARSLFGHSPKLCRLLQHAIMKNRSRSRSTTADYHDDQQQQPKINNGFIDSVVEDTIFCSSTTNLSESNKGCGFYFGSSKVYTSVFVAPSFSSDVRSEVEEGEMMNPSSMEALI